MDMKELCIQRSDCNLKHIFNSKGAGASNLHVETKAELQYSVMVRWASGGVAVMIEAISIVHSLYARIPGTQRD